jgi:hypothetical protein
MMRISFCIESRVDCDRVTLTSYHFLDLRSQYGVIIIENNSKSKETVQSLIIP